MIALFQAGECVQMNEKTVTKTVRPTGRPRGEPTVVIRVPAALAGPVQRFIKDLAAARRSDGDPNAGWAAADRSNVNGF